MCCCRVEGQRSLKRGVRIPLQSCSSNSRWGSTPYDEFGMLIKQAAQGSRTTSSLSLQPSPSAENSRGATDGRPANCGCALARGGSDLDAVATPTPCRESERERERAGREERAAVPSLKELRSVRFREAWAAPAGHPRRREPLRRDPGGPTAPHGPTASSVSSGLQ